MQNVCHVSQTQTVVSHTRDRTPLPSRARAYSESPSAQFEFRSEPLSRFDSSDSLPWHYAENGEDPLSIPSPEKLAEALTAAEQQRRAFSPFTRKLSSNSSFTQNSLRRSNRDSLYENVDFE